MIYCQEIADWAVLMMDLVNVEEIGEATRVKLSVPGVPKKSYNDFNKTLIHCPELLSI